jgi:hypothetical protein
MPSSTDLWEPQGAILGATRIADTVEYLIRQFIACNPQLNQADIIDVFASQESTEKVGDEYCEMTNKSETGSDEWFFAMMAGTYLAKLEGELPERVEYFQT